MEMAKRPNINLFLLFIFNIIVNFNNNSIKN
jgi:hypothetical protein